jgi:hypothetical protein
MSKPKPNAAKAPVAKAPDVQTSLPAAKALADTPPKLQVVYVPTDSLAPFARNARTHTPAQVDQIAGSMAQFGFTNPILVDGQRGIIAGHARLLAAKKLGLKEVPTIELVGLSDTQKRALILADNRISLNAGWDVALLGLELQELSGLGVELGTLGFDDLELDRLVPSRTAGLTDPDDVPEPPKTPVSKLGDLWLLGAHVTCPKCSKDTKLEQAVIRK